MKFNLGDVIQRKNFPSNENRCPRRIIGLTRNWRGNPAYVIKRACLNPFEFPKIPYIGNWIINADIIDAKDELI